VELRKHQRNCAQSHGRGFPCSPRAMAGGPGRRLRPAPRSGRTLGES